MKLKSETAFKIVRVLKFPFKVLSVPFYALGFVFMFIAEMIHSVENWIDDNLLWDLQELPRDLNERFKLIGFDVEEGNNNE